MNNIKVHDKFYSWVDNDGKYCQVRRDIYWDNGYKSPNELALIEQVEAELEKQNEH